MKELRDALKHSGVKGMKWGIIRWRKPGGNGGENHRPGRLKQEWNSFKRERHWKKILKEVGSLTTAQIGVASRRAGLENEYKKLSKSSIASGKDKKGYRLREKMSDQELNRKVGRLRAIHALKSQSDSATKQQRAIGKRIAQTTGSLAIHYALKKKLSPGDIYTSISNPKAAKDQAIKTVLDMVFKKRA